MIDRLHFKKFAANVKRRTFTEALADFFDTLLYIKPPKDKNEETVDREYSDNETFWKDALEGIHFEEMKVYLENFHVTEWLPFAPGKFFTQEASQDREIARNVYYDWGRAEFEPAGKGLMVNGGIGSLRLGAKLLNSEVTYFLGASSSGISHQGIPIAVNKEQYRRVIGILKKNGGCLSNLSGSLHLLPTSKSVIHYNRRIPRYCFFTEELNILEPSADHELLTSIAIIFPDKNAHPPNPRSRYEYFEKDKLTEEEIAGLGKSWSFCSFNPCQKDGLMSAVNWLKTYAQRYSGIRNPPILNDFDEHFNHFENRVEFSLPQLFQGQINMGHLYNYKGVYGSFAINIWGDLNMGDVFKNISKSTIINRSTVERSFNIVKEKYTEEVAMALVRIGEEISKSGNKEAAELFENFNEELQKPEPRKSVLKTVWNGIEKALPTIVKLVDVTTKVSKLFTGA